MIDTEEKAYWLGFIYADGYIINSIKGKTSDAFGITLQEKDKGHLEKFKKSINSNHPILTYVSAFNTKISRIIIYEQNLINDLIKNGVFRNKSLILKFPSYDIVPKDLIFHFMRGYFDGDGSFKKHGDEGYDFSVLGTYEFLIEFKNIMGIPNKIKHAKKDSTTNNYEIVFGGMKKVKVFAKKLYENSTIYLDRKYERYIEIINY